MGFIGPVNRVGQEFIRPHDVVIQHVPETGAVEAMIERIVHLGFEVRVELVLADGEPMWAQLTKAQAEELEIQEKQIVYVRPSRKKVFGEDGPRTEELVAA